MKNLLQLLLLIFISTNVVAQEKKLVHQDVKRKYIVYTPASYALRAHENFPVIVNYHGGGMTMREQMLYTQMNRMADRENVIVVYPQGIKQDWNVGFGMDYLQGTDDIGFTQAMLEKIKAQYRVDEKRVYATGLSRGGFFSLRVAAELPHVFAAVASVGATMPEPVVEHHAKPAKIGVMFIHGTGDQIVSYDGKKSSYLSASESYRYWIKNNALGAMPVAENTFNSDPSDGTEVASMTQGDGVHSVALLTIKDGGHTWAGADAFNIGLPIGKTSRDVDANAVIWEFLSKHKK